MKHILLCSCVNLNSANESLITEKGFSAADCMYSFLFHKTLMGSLGSLFTNDSHHSFVYNIIICKLTQLLKNTVGFFSLNYRNCVVGCIYVNKKTHTQDHSATSKKNMKLK